MPAPSAQTPPSVLSTLNPDGSRRWLRPRPSRGRFWRRRRALACLLIGLFTLIPFVRINGRPLLLLDIANRELSAFGAVFFPTDTLLFALLFLSIFVAIFLLTAITGRVWCGWACPQTVYMEFLFRPIERFFEGEPGRRAKKGAWRKPAKLAAYLVVCLYLAHTFLAYFVGVDQLRVWMTRSPFEHPASFLVMAATTGLMMFDFCFFREQTCLVACPYGRFQSVLLDRSSLIVSYDPGRGEPRGKMRKPAPGADLALNVLPDQPGDCIDCHKCVTTCPTGIDIRDGLQMECVHCTQCIDACDEVMDRIGRPRGLIRYGSQASIAGEKRRFLRPRIVIYPVLLAILLTGLAVGVASKDRAEVTMVRARGGMPFFRTREEGVDRIATRAKVRVRNRTDSSAAYTISLEGVPGGRINLAVDPLVVEPFGIRTEDVVIFVPPPEFGRDGRREVTIAVRGSDGFEGAVSYDLVGPAWLGDPNEPTGEIAPTPGEPDDE